MPTEAEIAAAAAAEKAKADAAIAAAAAKGPSKKQLQGDLAAAWGKIAMMERQLPELIEAKASQLVEKKLAEMGHKPAAGTTKDKEPNADERITKLEAELKARDERALNAERRSKVASAFAGVAFMNEKAQSIAIDEVLAQAKEKDGKLFVPTLRKLETTGEEISVDLPLTEAAQRYLKSNEWLVKGEIRGGSGAAGSTGAAGAASGSQSAQQPIDWTGIKYRDLKANPLLMQRAIKEKGQAWVTEKHSKYLAKRGQVAPSSPLKPVASATDQGE